MVMDVMEFQEEAASLRSIPELQEAMTRAMIRLDLPYFIYAWSDSLSPHHLNITGNSFFSTITDKFFKPYIESGLFRHDYSIHACRGTTTIPSLIGRSCHRWRNVSRAEMNKLERTLDEFEREYFVDGLTIRIENHNKSFFSGASLIGQGMSMPEFNHALTNTSKAFMLLRIYHDRFHLLLSETGVPSQSMADMLRRDEMEDADVLLNKMISRSPAAPDGRIIVAAKYEINATVVNVIENNNAPISIDARAVEVDASDIGNRQDDGTPSRESSAPLAETFEHSPGYDRIRLHGKSFRFGAVQARIIRMLHEASQTPDPWIAESILLTNAGSASQHLRELFKNHEDRHPGFLFEKSSLGTVRLKL